MGQPRRCSGPFVAGLFVAGLVVAGLVGHTAGGETYWREFFPLPASDVSRPGTALPGLPSSATASRIAFSGHGLTDCLSRFLAAPTPPADVENLPTWAD